MTNVVPIRGANVGKLTEADFDAQIVANRERFEQACEAAERAAEPVARDKVVERGRVEAIGVAVGAVAALLTYLYMRYGARVL